MSPRLPCVGPCDRPVLPEESHVRLEAHLVRTDDRDGQETFYAHTECYHEMTEGWSHP